MSSHEQLVRTLHAHQQSITAPRAAVFSALQQAEALTMPELIAQCAPIDRASVYRTIDLFERLGIIQRIQVGWKYRLELSDTFREHHHHATCLRCGKHISVVEPEELAAQLAAVGKQYGFTVTAHHLELSGYCTNCAPKE